MKRIFFLVLALTAFNGVFAQTTSEVKDTTVVQKVTVNKDPRLDLLAKAEVDIANAAIKMAARYAKGYRLFVLKTDDRNYAMKVRSYLLQNFPEEKVIMSYQAPFIKMKFGDFLDKEEAEKVKKQIVKGGVVTGGIYVVPDTIEVKPDKEVKDDTK
ncbi:MAG: hypothetical protein ACKOU7_07480 [Ferruginibacter sp.]